MAGNKNQSNRQNAGNGTNRKTQNGNNGQKAKNNTTTKTPAREMIEEDNYSFSAEITVWIVCAVMLILELGNFGLCGFINHVSDFLFGMFGAMEYVLPLVVMFAAFFLHINEYKKRAVHKVIFGSFILLCFGMIAQMTEGIDGTAKFAELVKDFYTMGFSDKAGGGVICGLLALAMQKCVGTVGTYIILLVAIIVCIVLFAEVSVIDMIKGVGSISRDFRDDQDDEDYYDYDSEPKKTKRYRRERNDDFVVKEDYPGRTKNRNYEAKGKSVLDQISVLPAGSDKGIISGGNVNSNGEEIHEITMSYDDLTEDKDTTVIEQPKKTKKESVSKKSTKRVTEKAIVPEVLPQEEKKVSNQLKPEPSLDITKMENKTAEATPNRSAKEVGLSDSEYQFPPIDLLKKGKAQEATNGDLIREKAIKLQEVLRSFGVNVTMTNYSCGPSVTRYEMVPEQGVKVSKITGLADDIMMNLAAQSIRIEAPIPGKSAVGIEIPNDTRAGVGFRELIDTDKFINHKSKIAVAVGKDIEGNVIVEDIAKMPHLLIAGATGSGKSVCTNTLIMSILYKARPDEVKLILVDPKQVELKVYNGIPHLLTPVVTDPKKAAGALNWAVAEMTRRYNLFSECSVRNIEGYNAKVKEIENSDLDDVHLKPMEQIVIIVDELADLMMVAKAEVEEAIVRLAQLARAAGIHLVIATQRPSVDVVTGLIKANVPSRIALSVSSGVDSRTIIDSVGAEKLLGNGDMLFSPTTYPKPLRVQGAYISDEEVVRVVDFLKEQNGVTEYSEEVTNQITTSVSSNNTKTISDTDESDDDEYLVDAGRFIIEKNKASIGMLQRQFKIGFNRAARIMDQLHATGVVGPEEGTKPRQILMSIEEFEELMGNTP